MKESSRLDNAFSQIKEKTKACVIHVAIRERGSPDAVRRRDTQACLEEAVGLALAIDLDVIHQQIIPLQKIVPATLMGKGNVEHFASIIVSQDIAVVIMDAALTPVQQRNLERSWKCKVIDRTGLILEIFGARARTAEGVLQVELAALSYQRSRLVRAWTHLERQRGGFGFTGGPGESQIELDRRMIDERIIKIKKQLEQSTRTRSLQRRARASIPYPIVALVGYTNAGKSTLFNALTQSDVFAQDLLFATLDPTMRQLKLPSGRQIILSDTVGFISNLPTQLIAAFRATLEEVCGADVILHIRDAAHIDSHHQAADVVQVLSNLGLDEAMNDGTLVDVYNKIDLLPLDEKDVLKNQLHRQETALPISAVTGEGVPELLRLIDAQLNRRREDVMCILPSESGEILAWLYRKGAIVHRSDQENGIHLHLKLTIEDGVRLRQFLPIGILPPHDRADDDTIDKPQ